MDGEAETRGGAAKAVRERSAAAVRYVRKRNQEGVRSDSGDGGAQASVRLSVF